MKNDFGYDRCKNSANGFMFKFKLYAISTKMIFVVFMLISFHIFHSSIDTYASPLHTSRGKWDFVGSGFIGKTVAGTFLYIWVINKSTDDSYSKRGCQYGCATALVDWEIWHTDAGMMDSGTFEYKDICNGDKRVKTKRLNIDSKYNVLDVRWNVKTPNGGHSFHKSRSIFKMSDIEVRK